MSERYWITGTQLGLLRSVVPDLENIKTKILKEIEENQFIGNIESANYDKYDIVLRKKKTNR